MRKSVRISPTLVPLLTVSNVDRRRSFPAWIESDDPVPALTLGGTVVLPRIRAALPLRRVILAAVSITLNRRMPDAHRLR
jgi:hypothetical protein